MSDSSQHFEDTAKLMQTMHQQTLELLQTIAKRIDFMKSYSRTLLLFEDITKQLSALETAFTTAIAAVQANQAKALLAQEAIQKAFAEADLLDAIVDKRLESFKGQAPH